MHDWFQVKYEVESKLINAIMGELESLITNPTTANYWIDERHNVFAFINNNGDGDSWIEIHYELYDCNEECIGVLGVFDTDSVCYKELRQVVIKIVVSYLGS